MGRLTPAAGAAALSNPHVTFAPAGPPAGGALLAYDLAELTAAGAAAAAAALGLPGGIADHARLAVPDRNGARIAEVPVVAVPLPAAWPALLRVPADGGPPWRRLPDSLRLWAHAAHLARRFVAAQQLAPTLLAGDGDAVTAGWVVLPLEDASGRAALEALAAAMPPAAHALPLDEASVWPPDLLLQAFVDAAADLAVRAAAPAPRPGRPRARLLPWTARWTEALADPGDAHVPLGDEGRELVAGVAGWLAAAGSAGSGATVELRLAAPEDPQAPWTLTFGVRTEDGAYVPAAEVWAPADGALPDVLLSGLARAARAFPPLDRALGQAAPTAISVGLEDAWTFVAEAAPLLVGLGVVVVLPHELAAQQLRARVRLDVPAGEAAQSGAASLSWEAVVGEEILDEAALTELAAAGGPLVHWRGRWVRVDADALELARTAAHGGGQQTIPLTEALALGLAGSWSAADLLPPGAAAAGDAGTGAGRRADDVEVVLGERVAELIDRIRAAGERPSAVTTPDGFVGELRGYQRRGVAWLGGMAELGLGGVLADAMGLGKTVQLIAHLLGRTGPFLVVCPTSVLGNWQRELARFAPTLAVTPFHGPQRPERLPEAGVVVTTYGMLRREADALAAVDWDVVALDEAQFVKNPATAGARAVRRLRSRQTVALTGTPLENRLAELWALLDATNRGLLGSRARFTRRFVNPVEQQRDAATAVRLRRLVAPFVLRRTKDDPAVVGDLPPKIERDVICGLTPEQAGLYQAAVARALTPGPDGVVGAEALARRGRILALLGTLKQICNHPAQHLGERRQGHRSSEEVVLTGRSGKLAVAREIVAEAVSAGEQVLVFTQYVEMGHLLVQQLSADLDVPIPFLHGGLPASARDAVVASFQGEDGATPAPVLVVSLRAGGTGLNLTAATHVVHYDRWWNPAVEDQATDRAHRIGQTRTVEVHRLVTAGTVEERIAAMLERKRDLAEQVVGAGEAWIADLGDEQLADLVTLGPEAVLAEVDDEDDWAPAGARSAAPGGWEAAS